MPDDWLIGSERSGTARERILDGAEKLIARRGLERFDVGELARSIHCSRATVYRHISGRQEIIDAVLTRTSAEIVAGIRASATGSGRDRARRVLSTTLAQCRENKVAQRLIDSRDTISDVSALVRSPTLATIGAELLGLSPGTRLREEWLIRGIISLLLWPPTEPSDESELLDQLIDLVLV